MQTRNKNAEIIRIEAKQICMNAKEAIKAHTEKIKRTLESEHHGALDNEIIHVMNHHQSTGETLKGPNGLAAKVRQSDPIAETQANHLSKMGNQKAILRFLNLHAAHDKLEQRLSKNVDEIAIAMAAKRVEDLLGA